MMCDNTLDEKQYRQTPKKRKPAPRRRRIDPEGARMKKKRILALLFAMVLLLCACNQERDPSYTDTLPCDEKSGYTWVARLVSGSTGAVNISQTYSADDTYALMGASGILENAFTGVTPGLAIVRLYYVNPLTWDGLRSSAEGVAYYEFEVYDDLTIRLLYSEVELPGSY